MSNNLEKIRRFWNWFEASTGWLGSLVERTSAPKLAVIDREVADVIEGATWELGPGVDKPNSFVLSPDRSRERLALTRAAVKLAPAINDWEIYPAKQRRQWKFEFEMNNARGQSVQIDAANWRYSLIAYSNRSFFDITLYATNLPPLDLTARKQASWIVVEGELGEEMGVERIGHIELQPITSYELTPKTGRIDRLHDHLTELVGFTGSDNSR